MSNSVPSRSVIHHVKHAFRRCAGPGMVLIAFLSFSHTYGQPAPLTGRLVVAPILSSFISDWERNPNQIRLSVVNISQGPLDVRFELEMKGRRTGLYVNSPGKQLVVTPGAHILLPKDVLDFEKLRVQTESWSTARVTRRLPDDDWELCVKMIIVTTNQVVLTCSDFTLQYAIPPMLIHPQNEDQITTRFPLFQWNAASMQAGIRISYKLKICELHAGQNARQALDSNPVHFEQSGIAVTSLLYPVGGLPFQDQSRYVWQVQAFDEYGTPLGDSEGKSEIWSFQYFEVK